MYRAMDDKKIEDGVMIPDLLFLPALIVVYAGSLVGQIRKSAASFALLITAVCLHLVYLLVRTVLAGHAPFSGAYESMTFFPFLIGLKLCFIARAEIFRHLRSGALILVLAMLIGATFLPGPLKERAFIPPALKSSFFFVHVPLFFLGYMSLAFSFILGILRMISKRSDILCDRVILAEARTGYVFISAGLVTGGLWAFLCWGRFWGWDPKESWALVAWLVYTAGLHSRTINSRIYRVTLILGFCVILFAYLGVMFLMPSIHSYR
jgi:ABC-type transport system involved in cytochrome c biogenesis permease subunit